VKVDFRVTGMREASAAVESIPLATRELIGDEFQYMAREIELDAKQRAPYRFGELVRSLGHNLRGDRLQATVGSSLFRARFAEFGTSRQRKHPFLYPAYRTSVRLFRKRMKNIEPRLRAKTRLGSRTRASTRKR
jgi:HK97 gp10 family phage protein